MSINPATVCLYIPPGLGKWKLVLFERIAHMIRGVGGHVLTATDESGNGLASLPPEITPIVGCSPHLTPLIKQWRAENRQFIYWDRGYCRRRWWTCLPTGPDGGYYRWHVNGFQMQRIREVPDDRWRRLDTPLQPWRKGGKHIVVAAPTRTYAKFHETRDWIADTIFALASVTDRQMVIRDKEQVQRRPLQLDLEGAHALVTHGSNAAVEAAILGTPVFVHPDSAAALVGQTDLRQIESPVYPDREAWANSLAYSNFNEKELTNGTLWRLIE